MDRLDGLRRIRMEKLARLRELGAEPYPHTYRRTHTAAEILDRFDELAEKERVAIAGRMMSFREMGKASFAHIQDASGRIQVYLRKDSLPPGYYEWLKHLDLGDILGVEGTPFRTKTGEITVRADGLTVLCKTLSPMPISKEKDGAIFDGVSDKEFRYRHRHIDLILNPEARKSLVARSSIVQSLRRYLDARGFLEVETPVLQNLYGGAMARPFVTHHNALSTDLYLRIALELHLKRLLVGGIERVYELGRVFRNEGMDKSHNPEFTMLEFYWAYADYQDAMAMVEEMIRTAAQETVGSLTLQWGETVVDLKPPFVRAPMRRLVSERTGIDIVRDPDQAMEDWLVKHDEKLPALPGRGPLIEYVFDAAVVPHLEQPTFVIDYPRSLSPLTKAHREHPADLVERFELFIGGREFANAFSELNDPLDQRARMEEQVRRRALGDEEAQQLDEEFLLALEHGMPPAAGVGIGVDRLVMLLTGETSIRDVVFFPQMKAEEETPEGIGEGPDEEPRGRSGGEPEGA